MWGWTTPRDRCFDLLDRFYAAGLREVDAATNYPINKQPEDFRRSETILLEWINAHGVSDLKVMMKVGSLNNMRTPDHNLTRSFLLLNLDDYRFRFGDNLDTLMIHWDNRSDAGAIRETLEALSVAHEYHLRVGLSGVRHPEVYAAENRAYQLDFRIQIKHNLLHSDYHRYPQFHGRRRFITYGINAGGIKLNPAEYHDHSSLAVRGGDVSSAHPITTPLETLLTDANRNAKRPAVQSFNHCGLCFAYHSPDIGGILIGPSRTEQLDDSLAFFRALATNDYRELYQKLRALHQKHARSV